VDVNFARDTAGGLAHLQPDRQELDFVQEVHSHLTRNGVSVIAILLSCCGHDPDDRTNHRSADRYTRGSSP
jgi:hypothetical protein